MSPVQDMDRICKTPLFFIVGRPRTGSTLLRTLFDAHPNVTIPQEWPMLLALYRKFGHIRHWKKKDLEEFNQALYQRLRIPYWEITNWPGFNSTEIRNALLSCEGEHSFETLFKLVYSHYHSYFPKEKILLFGDKNPAYSNQAELLAQIFPSARFIHLTRDYRDNLASMLNVDFEMPNAALLTYRWRYSWEKIEKVAAANPDRFLRVRYEDLVSDAPAKFGEICRFLDVPYDPSIFEFYKKQEEIERSFPKEVINHYFRSLFNPIDPSRVGIYRKELNSLQIRIADQVAGSTARKAGYERDYKRFNPLVFIWTLPAILYAKWLVNVGWMVGLLPYSIMMWLLNKPSVIVKWYTKLLKH